MAMHDGFGQAGGAAGIDHPQRVVEGQPLGLEGVDLGAAGGQQRGHVVHGALRRAEPRRIVGLPRRCGSLPMPSAPQHQLLDAGQRGQQFVQHRPAVVGDAAPAVAVGGDQHLGGDLAEAVEHRHRAHVGRADRPDRAQAGTGQEDDRGLGRVGQHGRHPVAALHAHAPERQRHRRHLAPQLGPADFAQRAGRQQGFVGKDDRRVAGGVRRIAMAQHLASVVDLGAVEPLRTRHALGVQHLAVGRG